MNLFQLFGQGLVVIALSVASLFGYHEQQPITLSGYNPTGGGTYRLQSSIGTTDTTIPLSSFKEPISNIPYTMTYLNSSIEYGTLEPGNTTKREFISFTGITQNSDGTALLTGVARGLSSSYPFTASTTLQQTHSGQSIFILSNSPQFYTNEFLRVNDYATSTGVHKWASTTPPRYDLVPLSHAGGTYVSTTSEFASIAYVNAISISGVSNSTESVKGIVELSTAREAASSTVLGATGAGLVLQGKYATDTPQNCVTTNCIVMSNLLGSIRQAWLDLTETWHFSSTTSDKFLATNATTSKLSVSGLINWGNFTYTSPTILSTTATGSVLLASSTSATTADITIGNPDWQQIGQTIATTSTGMAMNVNNLPARSDLRVVVYVAPLITGSNEVNLALRFNNDSTGGHYSYCQAVNGGTCAKTIGDSKIQLGVATNATSSQFADINIANPIPNGVLTFPIANYKLIYATSTATAALALDILEGDFTWVTGAQITTVNIYNLAGGVAFPIGSRVTVYAKRD